LPDYRIFETDEFLKKLAKLPARDARLVRRKLDEQVYAQLKKEPFLGRTFKKMPGYSPDIWRYRIGKFRMFYAVDEEARRVCILTIDLRRDAYR